MKLIIVCGVAMVAQLLLSEKVEAFSWGPMETFNKTVVVGENGIVPDPEAIDLRLVGADNELKYYGTDGVTLKNTYTVYPTSTTYINYFNPNETVIITKAGTYNGRYIDLKIKNVGVISGGSINISPNGTITFYRINNYASDYYFNFLNMTVVYHDTDEVIPNTKFYMPSYISSIGDQKREQYIKSYDKAKTKQFYMASTDLFLADHAFLDGNTSTSNIYMTANGDNKNGQGYFTVFGDTGTDGYRLGSYSQSGSATAINFFQPSLKSQLPVNYDPLIIPKTATSSEDGQKMELEMNQLLTRQALASYIPANDSFKLTITEKNTDFLEVKNSDFVLSVDGNEIANDGESYVIEVEKVADGHAMTLSLKTAFLNYWNLDVNAGSLAKTLKIKQSSTIKPNEAVIKQAINAGEFVMPTAAELNYELKIDNVVTETNTVVTPNQDVTLKVTPKLEADITTGYKVRKGTTLKDIPVSQLVKNQRNTYYPWDTVTAEYLAPTMVLNTAGNQNVVVNLKSGTFGTITPVTVTLQVQNDYVLTYDANGGQGTPPGQTLFTTAGTTIASGDTLSKEGYNFAGWSLKATPEKGDKIYQPGDTYMEQRDTVLYAVWQTYQYTVTGKEQFSWTTDAQLAANGNWVTATVFDGGDPSINEQATVDSIVITSKKGSGDADYVATNQVDMLTIGQTVYRVTVTGSTEIKGEAFGFTQEDVEVPVTIKKLLLTAQPADSIQIGRQTPLSDILFEEWVKNVQLEGELTPGSPLTKVELAGNINYSYNVSLKAGQTFDNDVIGFKDYTLVVAANTAINGQQSFGPIDVNVTVLVTGLGLSQPNELAFNPGSSGAYKNQLLKRQESDWSIGVQDTRVNPATDWSLYVKLEQPFQATSGGQTHEIKDILVYKGQDQEQPAYDTSVYLDSDNYQILNGKGNMTKTWDEDHGFLLASDSRKSMSIGPGDYHAVLQFTLADVPLGGSN